MPSNILFNVILPTLVAGGSFIGICTLSEREDNFVTELVGKKRKNGKPLINVIRITMVCDRYDRGRGRECAAAAEFSEFSDEP